MPNLSVIMSIYNENASQLEQAIKSILVQTFANFEFIIINDNPKNIELANVVNSFKSNDDRIVFIENKKNIGLAASLNKGLQISKSEFIARMDSDDISLPNRFELEIQFLQENTNIDLVSTNCYYIDKDDNIIGEKNTIPVNSKDIAKILPYGSTMIHPSFMFRSNSIKSIEGYHEYPTAEDYDLLLRMLKKGYNLASIDIPLIKYRIRPNSMTQSNKFLLLLTTQYQRILYKSKKAELNFNQKLFVEYLNANDYYVKHIFEKNNRVLNEFENIILSSSNLYKNFLKVLSILITNKYARLHLKNLIIYRVLKFKSIQNGGHNA